MRSKQQIADYQREYRKKNRQKAIAYQRAYYLRNLENIRDRNRRWYLDNKIIRIKSATEWNKAHASQRRVIVRRNNYKRRALASLGRDHFEFKRLKETENFWGTSVEVLRFNSRRHYRNHKTEPQWRAKRLQSRKRYRSKNPSRVKLWAARCYRKRSDNLTLQFVKENLAKRSRLSTRAIPNELAELQTIILKTKRLCRK